MSIEFRVRGFNAQNKLLMETVHSTESSAAIEIEAWQARMARKGDAAARAELIDSRPGGALTDLAVYPHTRIPWSWVRKSA